MGSTANFKNWLYGILLLVLWLPLLQHKFNLLELEPLKGSFSKADKPQFKLQDWMSGSFQKKYETWHNEDFGFRSTALRLQKGSRYLY